MSCRPWGVRLARFGLWAAHFVPLPFQLSTIASWLQDGSVCYVSCVVCLVWRVVCGVCCESCVLCVVCCVLCVVCCVLCVVCCVLCVVLCCVVWCGVVWCGVVLCCVCLLYTSPSPRDGLLSRMPSSA